MIYTYISQTCPILRVLKLLCRRFPAKWFVILFYQVKGIVPSVLWYQAEGWATALRLINVYNNFRELLIIAPSFYKLWRVCGRQTVGRPCSCLNFYLGKFHRPFNDHKHLFGHLYKGSEDAIGSRLTAS